MSQVKKFEEYQLKEKIYTDNMGKVYKALHKDFGKVELRVLDKKLSEDLAYKSSFLSNTKKAINIEHPNIVKIYQAGEFQERLFLSTEFFKSGGNLSLILDRQRKMPLKNTFKFVINLIDALIQLELKGLVHKDIRPENIYINSDGNAMLKNLGLIGNLKYNNKEYMLGNINYISPELIESHTKADIRSDIYSLGICFYQMITGVIPFFDTNEENILNKIKKGNLPNASMANSSVPHSISWVLDRMCQKNPDERFQTSQELLEVLSQMESQILGEARNEEDFKITEVPNFDVQTPDTNFQNDDFGVMPEIGSSDNLGYSEIASNNSDYTPIANNEISNNYEQDNYEQDNFNDISNYEQDNFNNISNYEQDNFNNISNEKDDISNNYEQDNISSYKQDNFNDTSSNYKQEINKKDDLKTKKYVGNKKDDLKTKKYEKKPLPVETFEKKTNLKPLIFIVIIIFAIASLFFINKRKEEKARFLKEQKKAEALKEKKEREEEKRKNSFQSIKEETQKALSNDNITILKNCYIKIDKFCKEYSKYPESNDLKNLLSQIEIKINSIEINNKYEIIEKKIISFIDKKDYQEAENLIKLSIEEPEYKEIKNKFQDLHAKILETVKKDFDNSLGKIKKLTQENKYKESKDILIEIEKYLINPYKEQIKETLQDIEKKEFAYNKINFLIDLERNLYKQLSKGEYKKSLNFVKNKCPYKEEVEKLSKYIEDLEKMENIFYEILKKDIKNKDFEFKLKNQKPFIGRVIIFSEKTGNLLVNIKNRSTNFNISELTFETKKNILSKKIPIAKEKTLLVLSFYLIANDNIELAEQELKTVSSEEKLWQEEKIARIIIDKIEKDKNINRISKLKNYYSHTESFKFKKHYLESFQKK